eukprot:gene1117-1276_t
MFLEEKSPNVFFLLLRHGDLDLIRYLSQTETFKAGYGIEFDKDQFEDFFNYLAQLQDISDLPNYIEIIRYVASVRAPDYPVPSIEHLIATTYTSVKDRITYPQLCYLALFDIADHLSVTHFLIAHPKYIVQTVLGFQCDDFTVPFLLQHVQTTVALPFDLICKYGSLVQVKLANEIIGEYQEGAPRKASHRSVEKATNAEVIKFLLNHRSEGSDSQDTLLDKAYERGDIVTLKFLASLKSKPMFSSELIALASGNMECILHACASGKTRMNERVMTHEGTESTIDKIIVDGRLDIIQHLGESHYQAFPLHYLLSSAIRLGSLPVVRFIHQHFPDATNIDGVVFDESLVHPSREIFDFLVNNRKEGFGVAAFKTAGRIGDIQTFETIKRCSKKDHSRLTFLEAVSYGNVDLVKHLVKYDQNLWSTLSFTSTNLPPITVNHEEIVGMYVGKITTSNLNKYAKELQALFFKTLVDRQLTVANIIVGRIRSLAITHFEPLSISQLQHIIYTQYLPTLEFLDLIGMFPTHHLASFTISSIPTIYHLHDGIIKFLVAKGMSYSPPISIYKDKIARGQPLDFTQKSIDRICEYVDDPVLFNAVYELQRNRFTSSKLLEGAMARSNIHALKVLLNQTTPNPLTLTEVAIYRVINDEDAGFYSDMMGVGNLIVYHPNIDIINWQHMEPLAKFRSTHPSGYESNPSIYQLSAEDKEPKDLEEMSLDEVMVSHFSGGTRHFALLAMSLEPSIFSFLITHSTLGEVLEDVSYDFEFDTNAKANLRYLLENQSVLPQSMAAEIRDFIRDLRPDEIAIASVPHFIYGLQTEPNAEPQDIYCLYGRDHNEKMDMAKAGILYKCLFPDPVEMFDELALLGYTDVAELLLDHFQAANGNLISDDYEYAIRCAYIHNNHDFVDLFCLKYSFPFYGYDAIAAHADMATVNRLAAANRIREQDFEELQLYSLSYGHLEFLNHVQACQYILAHNGTNQLEVVETLLFETLVHYNRIDLAEQCFPTTPKFTETPVFEFSDVELYTLKFLYARGLLFQDVQSVKSMILTIFDRIELHMELYNWFVEMVDKFNKANPGLNLEVPVRPTRRSLIDESGVDEEDVMEASAFENRTTYLEAYGFDQEDYDDEDGLFANDDDEYDGYNEEEDQEYDGEYDIDFDEVEEEEEDFDEEEEEEDNSDLEEEDDDESYD